MAANVVNGNFFQGFFGKHSEVKQLKESGNTCMYPVARITPEANALTIENKFLSGLRAGTAVENNGKHTPTMVVIRIEAIAMSLSFKDFALSWHPPPALERHCSANAGHVKEKIRREIVILALNFADEAMASYIKASKLEESYQCSMRQWFVEAVRFDGPIMDIEDWELVIETCITRNPSPAVTLERGLQSIREAVEELRLNHPPSSGILRFQDNVVLFLHGFLETGEDWMSIKKAISGSARCISIDLPGQGGSKMQNCEAKEATLSVEIVAHKFYKVIQGITPGKIVVVGYSMGAMIVLWMALRHVDKINAVIHRKTLIPFVQSPQLIFFESPNLDESLNAPNSSCPLQCGNDLPTCVSEPSPIGPSFNELAVVPYKPIEASLLSAQDRTPINMHSYVKVGRSLEQRKMKNKLISELFDFSPKLS
ncbi:hypothetical protein GH714_039983 [Hevea brasiliensis]|uniref:AB hydrolase-1 domain-containing protein n=1 Tax=Hevea brasiliensis TaxID=3981 RepID=A0A6A6MK70_HEVBR|nr:hypothetical protein GH714_039983 [Hevea brasiliensis]